ncbi:hypothetical protein NQZ68_014811 [Dissostichus eleginoides]|nr:hypothetical protein NQZ68_014811 [Dissostichus eleginoides]
MRGSSCLPLVRQHRCERASVCHDLIPRTRTPTNTRPTMPSPHLRDPHVCCVSWLNCGRPAGAQHAKL